MSQEPEKSSGGESIFSGPIKSLTQPAVTFREAVLGSLLAHAIIFIAILLAPPVALRFLDVPRRLLTAEDNPVHMTFIQDRPRPPQPNPLAPNLSDRDRRRAQEQQNPKKPSRVDPYSAGNTPARIAEAPLARHASPPAPQAPEPPAPGPPAPAAEEAAQAKNAIDARTGTGPLYVPPRGDDGRGSAENMEAKGERLKQALARMGAEGLGAGGSSLRYDNPSGGLATPSGSLAFDTQGFDWGPYSRRIYWIIWKNWHDRMPPAVYSGLKGQVVVHFVIHRDGRITDIRILSTSGIPAYDSAATLALEASSPLPPLPDNFPNDSDGVTGRFLYNMWEEDE